MGELLPLAVVFENKSKGVLYFLPPGSSSINNFTYSDQ